VEDTFALGGELYLGEFDSTCNHYECQHALRRYATIDQWRIEQGLILFAFLKHPKQNKMPMR
jgi:hypothetical protein